MEDEKTITFDDWKKMVDEHDLTYSYSDDSRAYNRGYASYEKIVRLSKNFPRADVVAYWNEVAAKKVYAPKTFLWS